ncbi:nitroreductase family deazaflavin-dependent oxidoreductase [Spiractinospora alimapuensis]|uniref:nitroreductase family deazaflavin-dependent oxidoreductase n=1 Tax=Spiractinospora alimapuensis TaxID=2820884 RepID=UPI001F2A214F|nr:nitroreductase family deazaflavin-dependent oxidoreductase [Spiractinospora alimapuensis]
MRVQPQSPVARRLFRAPVWIYRLGLGGLLGRNFVLLTTRGRVTGRPRQVVLEVVARDEETGGYRVVSGFGARSQWFRNIQADPRVLFEVGWRRYRGTATVLPPEESGKALSHYLQHRYGRLGPPMLRVLGHPVDGSPEEYERVGSDPNNGIPVIALRPSPQR